MEGFVQEDFSKNSIAPNHPVNRKSIEELVRKNAANHIHREFIDPFHVRLPEYLALALAHCRTTFQNPVRKFLCTKNVSRQQAAPGSDFKDGKGFRRNIQFCRHVVKAAGQKSSEDWIEVGRSVEIAIPPERILQIGIVAKLGMVKSLIHEVAKRYRPLLTNTLTKELNQL